MIPNPITTIEYIGHDARDIALRYHDVIKTILKIGFELFDAKVKVFVSEPPYGEPLEWTMQIRSCAGQRTLRITQNKPLGSVLISNA